MEITSRLMEGEEIYRSSERDYSWILELGLVEIEMQLVNTNLEHLASYHWCFL
jgi:hypothetical protein